MSKYIAVAGKGGVGKTTFTALILRTLVKQQKGSVLAVDADPNANLNEALGLKVDAVIADILEQTKDPRQIPSGMTKEMFIQYKLSQTMVETDNIDLLVMGGPQGPGCYCYPNDLLRKYLETLGENYNYVVVDTEAGLEHLSRRTIPHLDALFVISDASARGIRSAGRVHDIVKSLKTKIMNIYLVVTKTKGDDLTELQEEITNTGLNVIGAVPYDLQVADFDLHSRPLYNLPDDSPVVKAVEEIVANAKI